MPNFSELKEEINLTSDIGVITNAMQLVATAKLQKMGKRIKETRQYLQEVYAVFNDIIMQTQDSIFLKSDQTEFKKTLWVVVNSNLGLAGGYNNNINKLVLSQLKPNDEVYALGSKAINFYTNRKIPIFNEKTDLGTGFSSEQASEIGKELLEVYTNGQFDEIQIAYTKFINNATFQPATLRLFPVVKNVLAAQQLEINFEFEPDVETIFDKTINLYINTIIYGTIIESQVSEQASRRLAMENATNNSEEMLGELKIHYNRQRQAAITQEISEIVGAANALER